MTAADVVAAIRSARARDVRPAAPGADLSDVDLHGVDLSDADLRGTFLLGADLRGAYLRRARLVGARLDKANLLGADLPDACLQNVTARRADLRETDLRGANLRGANLWRSDLAHADLWGADLRGTVLRETNLWSVGGGVLQVTGLHPYQAILVPTCDGWALTIGCWEGSVPDLRALIAQDTGWPEARGAEVARRRPLLAALADLCDAHAAAHEEDLAAVAHWEGAV